MSAHLSKMLLAVQNIALLRTTAEILGRLPGGYKSLLHNCKGLNCSPGSGSASVYHPSASMAIREVGMREAGTLSDQVAYTAEDSKETPSQNKVAGDDRHTRLSPGLHV